jgi:hypothetical protein
VSPGSDEKQTYTEVMVTVTVTDVTVGVDGSTIEYRYGTDGDDSMGEWTTAGASSTGPKEYLVQVGLDLVPGTDNVVQFRAADILGNGLESDIASLWVNRAPTAVIKSPSSDSRYIENDPVKLNGTGSDDPDGDDLNYTWYREGDVNPIGYGMVLTVDLPPGIYNVTLVVVDDVGAEHTSSVEVTVDEYVPPTTQSISGLWWIILVVVLAAVAVASIYMMRRREDFEEWEEID